VSATPAQPVPSGPAKPPASAPRAGAPKKPVPAIAWGTRRDKAVEAARRDGKPLLMYFSAVWCGPCHDMQDSLWSRPDVIEMTSKFVCLNIDIDKDPSTAQRYAADNLPMVSIADPWGTELVRREGYSAPEPFVALLQAMPTDFKEVAPWQERLAANPKDVEALRQVGRVYQHLNLFDASTQALTKALQSKEAKAQPNLRAEFLTMIGWNHLRAHDLPLARKSFERCLAEVPTHPGLDVTLYGLLAVHLVSGEPDKAEPLLDRLETCCPQSQFTARARKDIANPPEPRP
jgi:thiol-disulfide isomerase/thioredoxin